MCTFVCRFIQFSIMQIVVCVALYMLGNDESAKDRHYISCLIDKHARLDSAGDQRIIFVGGSNLPYGINSERLENQLGRPVINMGLNSAVGLDFTLSNMEPRVSNDDLIVLSLEHEFFLGDLAKPPAFWHALGLAPRNLLGMGIQRVPWILDNGLYPFRQIARHAFTGWPQPTDLLSRDNVNVRGDIFLRPDRFKRKISPPAPIQPTSAARCRAISRIELFRKRIVKRGAKLVIVYPYVSLSGIEVRGDFYHLIHLDLVDANFYVVGTPAEASLPDDYFYDGEYHLTEQGANMRSKRLGLQLRPIVEEMAKKSQSH